MIGNPKMVSLEPSNPTGTMYADITQAARITGEKLRLNLSVTKIIQSANKSIEASAIPAEIREHEELIYRTGNKVRKLSGLSAFGQRFEVRGSGELYVLNAGHWAKAGNIAIDDPRLVWERCLD